MSSTAPTPGATRAARAIGLVIAKDSELSAGAAAQYCYDEISAALVIDRETGVADLLDCLELMQSALERTELNLTHAIRQRPVRDLAENLGENKHATEQARALLAAHKQHRPKI